MMTDMHKIVKTKNAHTGKNLAERIGLEPMDRYNTVTD